MVEKITVEFEILSRQNTFIIKIIFETPIKIHYEEIEVSGD